MDDMPPMIPIGDAAAFVVARLEQLVQRRGVKTLDDFETAAEQAAILIQRDEVDRQQAVDALWEIAEASGLLERHDVDLVQSKLVSGFGRAAIEAARQNAALDRKALEADARQQAARGLIATRMTEIVAQPIRWLWPNRLAIGKVTTLAGEGGLGKSTLLFDVAARVSRGDAWPDGDIRNTPGVVLILSSEDDPADTVKPRLEAAGADMSKVFFLSMTRDESGNERGFNLQADLKRLEELIRRLGAVRLVIIDPVSAYLGKVDSNSNADVRTVLGPLGEMAARTGVAVICNTHFAKSEGRSANQRILGSVAFVNQSRMVFIVTPDADDRDRRLFLPSKSNISRIDSGLAFRIEQTQVGEARDILATRIVWEPGPVSTSADAALAALRTDEPGAKSSRDEAVAFLTDALRHGPMAAAEVTELGGERGFTPKLLRAAREQLGIKPQKVGHIWTWALPALN